MLAKEWGYIPGQDSVQTDDFDKLLTQLRQIGKDVIQAEADDVDEKARFPKGSIEALKELKLLSAYVPKEQGGIGLNVIQIARICELLGHYCGSTAMIFAMHQIQVACLVHHCQESAYFREYIARLVAEQRLIASATTEIGVGGDLRSSICAVDELSGDRFEINKQAPVISYALDAEDIMVTARGHPEAAASDQVHLLVERDACRLDPISGWDTLGFRGTCSSGFNLSGSGHADQILPVPFSDILSQSMHPVAHVTWSALWSGIAAGAVNMARAFVRTEAKRNVEMPPISAIRLGEVDAVLQTMRGNLAEVANEYYSMLLDGDTGAFSNFGFGVRVNNLKISSSELVVDIVGKSMLICGIGSYRNDSRYSLCRHIRDAYGAALMVNNDRIMLHNSTLLLMHKEET